MSGGPINELYFSDEPLSTHHDHHKHNVYQMLYITEGALSCEIAGNRMRCEAPALVFIGNYEPHILSSASERYARYVLTLDPYKTDAALSPRLLQSVFSFRPVGFSHVLDVGPIADELRVHMEELCREWNAPKEKKLPEGEALLLSALLYRIRSFSPSHFTDKPYGAAEMIVTSVRMELECNFQNKLDLDALAARHHISRYYLAHIFKQVTGYSLKEYLSLCRISFAIQQLASGTQSVREIAEASGFHDMSNFSRAFKERMGLSPTDFRKQTLVKTAH